MFYINGPFLVLDSVPLASWSLCRLEDGRGCEGFLTECEKVDYEKLKSATRRREWLAARIALKRILLDDNLVDSPLECHVEKDFYGCPVVIVRRAGCATTLNCSISHKNGLSCVSVAFSAGIKVGIDVEAVSDKPWRLRSAFEGDDDILANVPEYRQFYAILWACKEAASKALGVGMLIDFKKLTVTGREDGNFSVFGCGVGETRGSYLVLKDLVIAGCYRAIAPSSIRHVNCNLRMSKGLHPDPQWGGLDLADRDAE